MRERERERKRETEGEQKDTHVFERRDKETLGQRHHEIARQRDPTRLDWTRQKRTALHIMGLPLASGLSRACVIFLVASLSFFERPASAAMLVSALTMRASNFDEHCWSTGAAAPDQSVTLSEPGFPSSHRRGLRSSGSTNEAKTRCTPQKPQLAQSAAERHGFKFVGVTL